MPATRWALAAALTLAACESDTNFQNTGDDNQEVEGSGEMEYSPIELVFEDLSVGTTYSQDITFTAVGEVNLRIYEIIVISSGEGTFYLGETEDLAIAPGSSLPITVTASLADDAVKEGTLRVKSNDVDLSEFTIPLIACPESYAGVCAEVNDPEDSGGADDSGAADDSAGADDTGA